jgi:hypothetical protein
MKRDPRYKFSINEEQKIINLYKKGLCLSQVGIKFDVGSTTIQKILKRNNIDRRSHGEGTRLLHKHLEINSPVDFPWHLRNHFQKLLSIFLLTDGYMKKGGGIMLINTDHVLQRYFLTLIKEAYGLSPTVNSFMKKGKETIVHSVFVYSDLLKNSPSYSTCPRCCSLEKYIQKPQPSLDFLEDENIELLKECIRLAMSTDGTVNVDFPHRSIYPKLELSCAHPILVNQWKQIFEKIGIKSYLIKSNVTWSKIRGLGIKELKSIRRFAEMGGFIKGVKITGKSKYFKGVTKNKLLNLIIFMNKESFHFLKDLDIKDKNHIVREMIDNPIKYDEWFRIGVDLNKLKMRTT